MSHPEPSYRQTMTDDHEADLRTLVREFRSSVSAELSAQNKAMLNLD